MSRNKTGFAFCVSSIVLKIGLAGRAVALNKKDSEQITVILFLLLVDVAVHFTSTGLFIFFNHFVVVVDIVFVIVYFCRRRHHHSSFLMLVAWPRVFGEDCLLSS
jgi:hypothetical protein